MKDVKVNYEELERFLNYLQDKVNEVYQKETEQAILDQLQLYPIIL